MPWKLTGGWSSSFSLFPSTPLRPDTLKRELQQKLFVYDHDGNRVRKSIAGVTTYFLVDDQNPTGYAQVLEEFESTTETIPAQASRVIQRRYAYGHDLLFQERKNGGSFDRDYYGYDGHGNVRFLVGVGTEGDFTIKDTYNYDAFGTLIEEWHLGGGSGTPNNYLYCGEQWDSDLGMYFLRARYLNPNTGRFWSMDSFEGSSEDPMSLHKYLYVHANPVMGSDPTGQSLLVDLLASTTIRAYLITTVVNYVVGKAISAAYLMLSDGNLSRFQWFEYSDTLAMVPGAVILNAVKLPVQMVTRVGGMVVGKALASGGVQRVVNGFSQWFASSGGKLVMRSADKQIIALEKGVHNAATGKGHGFTHLIQRHLTAFWDGSKIAKTSFWPSNVSPGEMLNLLKEAASKYVVSGAAAQPIRLSNGITAMLVVHGGKVTTFYPLASQPGVISAIDLVKAVP
ncbi:MAG: hypothetical protein HOP33_23100 [Verrucomicrobia bacterium]|nr:hypothetical protein [Verrucomicrobiota bacterium]